MSVRPGDHSAKPKPGSPTGAAPGDIAAQPASASAAAARPMLRWRLTIRFMEVSSRWNIAETTPSEHRSSKSCFQDRKSNATSWSVFDSGRLRQLPISYQEVLGAAINLPYRTPAQPVAVRVAAGGDFSVYRQEPSLTMCLGKSRPNCRQKEARTRRATQVRQRTGQRPTGYQTFGKHKIPDTLVRWFGSLRYYSTDMNFMPI